MAEFDQDPRRGTPTRTRVLIWVAGVGFGLYLIISGIIGIIGSGT